MDDDPGPQVRGRIAQDQQAFRSHQFQAARGQAPQGPEQQVPGQPAFQAEGSGPFRGWVNTGTRLIHSHRASQ